MTSQEELFKENSKAILQRYIMKEGYIVFRLFTLRHRRPYFSYFGMTIVDNLQSHISDC